MNDADGLPVSGIAAPALGVVRLCASGKVGALLLITSTAFAVPTYAAEPAGQDG